MRDATAAIPSNPTSIDRLSTLMVSTGRSVTIFHFVVIGNREEEESIEDQPK
jgi:hypothetical protein